AMIYVGQTVQIPGKGSSSSSSGGSSSSSGGHTSSKSSESSESSEASEPAQHTVAAGDTVSGLAAKYGTPPAGILDANGLGSSGAGHQASKSSESSKSSEPSESVQHTVAGGDTVSGLAAKYGTSTSAIIDANGLGSSGVIRVGQELTIPGGLVADSFLHYTYS